VWANTIWDTRVVNQPLSKEKGAKQKQVEKCGDPTTFGQRKGEQTQVN